MNDGTYNYNYPKDWHGQRVAGKSDRDAYSDGTLHSERVANTRRILSRRTDTRPTEAAKTSDITQSTFVFNIWDILDEAGNLLIKKHHDYGPTNISRSPGGPLNGLRVRMWDKVARINNLVDKDIDPNNESLRDSFIDLLNYSVIAIMVLEDKWPEK